MLQFAICIQSRLKLAFQIEPGFQSQESGFSHLQATLLFTNKLTTKLKLLNLIFLLGSSDLEVLAALEDDLGGTLALCALELQHNLLGGLHLWVKGCNGLVESLTPRVTTTGQHTQKH